MRGALTEHGRGSWSWLFSGGCGSVVMASSCPSAIPALSSVLSHFRFPNISSFSPSVNSDPTIQFSKPSLYSSRSTLCMHSSGWLWGMCQFIQRIKGPTFLACSSLGFPPYTLQIPRTTVIVTVNEREANSGFTPSPVLEVQLFLFFLSRK